MNLRHTLATGGQPYFMLLNGGGGGKGGGGVQYVPQQTPPPPVEEASVQIDTENTKKKVTQGKSELKVPMMTSANTGLNV